MGRLGIYSKATSLSTISMSLFLPKPNFEGYRNNAKKEFEENQNHIGD
jgi:hypothetical protein